jgi:excinuclease ABC subunit C
MTSSELKSIVQKLPPSPGVYFFKDKSGKNLYIGKAINLKNRVRSYGLTKDVRIQRMVQEADHVDHKIATNEIEALIMESLLIKENRPQFNIMMRDDKQYAYVIFTQDYFPRMYISHQPMPRDEYVGPFTDSGSLKAMLNYLRRIFPYCTCKQKHNNRCLNYHIGKCYGFCCLKNHTPSEEEMELYDRNIKAIKQILSGRKSDVIKNLKAEMQKSAAEYHFEDALKKQAEIDRINRIFDNTKIIKKLVAEGLLGNEIKYNKDLDLLKKELGLKNIIHRIEGYDISNIQGEHATGAMVVFENGLANKNLYRKFKIKTKKTADDTGMIKEILTRRMNHPEWTTPDLILIDGGKGQLSAAKSVIKNIPVIALTKNEKHFGHKIFVNNKDKIISLTKLTPSVKNLILKVDTEAHRFAISYYRALHKRKLTSSILPIIKLED